MNNGISTSVDVIFLSFEIFVVLFITFMLGLILGWIFSSKNTSTQKEKLSKQIQKEDDPLKEVGASETPFVKILGLGDKHREILLKEGITNYDELSLISTKKLEHILPDILKEDSFYRTWPNQAKFAAEEKWTDLHHYQAILSRTKNNNKKVKSSNNKGNISKKQK